MRFVCLNTGLLSFTLTMVTIISKESLCRKGEVRESKIKIRPLGGDPDLQREQRGWWMWLWSAASPQCGWVGFVPTRSLPIPRASGTLTVRAACMSAKKRTSLHLPVWALGKQREVRAALRSPGTGLSVCRSAHLPSSVLTSQEHQQQGVFLYVKTKNSHCRSKPQCTNSF